MEYTKTLIKKGIDLSLQNYVNNVNKLSNDPINNDILINDFIDISLSKYIHHYVLIKYGIISKNTNVKNFLKLYIHPVVSDGSDYYITNDDFKIILSYESHNLHDKYNTVLRYIRWYQQYQCRLGEVLDLKERYNRLKSMLSEIREQYSLIDSLKDGSELDISLEHEREGLLIMERDIKNMKHEIQNNLNRIL